MDSLIWELTFIPNELVRIEVSYKVLGIIDMELCHSSIMYQYSKTDMHSAVHFLSPSTSRSVVPFQHDLPLSHGTSSIRTYLR